MVDDAGIYCMIYIDRWPGHVGLKMYSCNGLLRQGNHEKGQDIKRS